MNKERAGEMKKTALFKQNFFSIRSFYVCFLKNFIVIYIKSCLPNEIVEVTQFSILSKNKRIFIYQLKDNLVNKFNFSFEIN